MHTRNPLSLSKCSKNGEFQIAKKVKKINLRIISKPHAYLQSMVTTSVKFQENRNRKLSEELHTQGIHYLFTLSRIKKGNNSHKIGP